MTESVLERTEAAKPAATTTDSRETGMEKQLIRQRKAFLNNPAPSAEERLGWLKTLKKALLDNKQALIQTLDADFGGRAHNDTLLAEFMPSLEGIKYCSKNLKKWMKPVRRHVSVQLQPASAKVLYQPLGVVGIVVPWNYPLYLACGPLVHRSCRRQQSHDQDV